MNDYCLVQMKLILGETGAALDTTLLPYLEQAVYDVDRKVGIGMTVTVAEGEYTLTPAPTATSSLWNVLAYRGTLLYLAKLLRDFRGELEGLSSISDEVTKMSRGVTMQEMRAEIEQLSKEYKVALSDYRRGTGGTRATMEEIETREDV